MLCMSLLWVILTARKESRFYGEFLNLVSEHNLIIADMTRLQDAFTYISDDGRIDHVLGLA